MEQLSDRPERPVAARQRKPEPVLIERARRIGWAMLALSVTAMVVGRVGPDTWRGWMTGVAVALGLVGLLFIVNVALVRGLYRELDKVRDTADEAGAHQSK